MNINNFNQHFHSQPTSFYDSLLSLEKFIDKKHAFDDFAHLVFKAPLFEDLMAVVSVYTGAFGPMTDREVAMVQKRMYQLNRQTVRAMHEIINQKQLIAGINSKEINMHAGISKTSPGISIGPMTMNTTPLPALSSSLHANSPPQMTSRLSSSQHFGNFQPSHHPNEMPTTLLNTPVATPNGPDRFLGNNCKPMSAGRPIDYNDRPSMTVQELLRLQQNWASSVFNNNGCQRMNESSSPSLHVPTTPASMAMMDNSVAAAAAAFFMTPPSQQQTPIFPAAAMNERSMILGNIDGCCPSNVVDNDCNKMRPNGGRVVTTRRRLRSETALLDM